MYPFTLFETLISNLKLNVGALNAILDEKSKTSENENNSSIFRKCDFSRNFLGTLKKRYNCSTPAALAAPRRLLRRDVLIVKLEKFTIHRQIQMNKSIATCFIHLDSSIAAGCRRRRNKTRCNR